MGVMGSLSQQLINIYDGRGLQRSHSLGWKQDATLAPGGEARGNMSGLSSWHPGLTRAGGGSRFIGTRAAQLVVGVERERERERERILGPENWIWWKIQIFECPPQDNNDTRY